MIRVLIKEMEEMLAQNLSSYKAEIMVWKSRNFEEKWKTNLKFSL